MKPLRWLRLVPVRKLRATVTVVAASVLLAAACSNGGDDADRGTPPAATTSAPAPAVTASTATATTSQPVTATTNGAPVTPTPTATTTPTAVTGTTTGATTSTTGEPTATTEPVTSTTGSGPTVPTTLPTTDDTTTPTTAATDDTDTDMEPRNKVDEQYPLGSDARKAYLAASGGVAPVGATVSLDLGPSGQMNRQHGRTSEDRYPNGYPAAPGSPNYQTTTLAQREALRAARWVAAMERGGTLDGFLESPALWLDGGLAALGRLGLSETPEITQLREYAGRGPRAGEAPPAHLVWALPRHQVCGRLASANATDHANSGVFSLSCEVLLDWTLWAVEQLVDPALAAQPVYQQMWTVLYRKTVLEINALPTPPVTVGDVLNATENRETRRVARQGIRTVLEWLTTWDETEGVDPEAWRQAAFETDDDLRSHFAAEIRAGRKPWETVP